MEIRVLRYFLTVLSEESITKASEVLHITQPTLSRQLAQMEEDIGVKLFDRGTRKIKLTNEGILLRRRAEEILQLVDKTEKELVEQEEQGKKNIRESLKLRKQKMETERINTTTVGAFKSGNTSTSV